MTGTERQPPVRYECPACGFVGLPGGDTLVRVWEDRPATSASPPDFIGCKDCSEMHEFDESNFVEAATDGGEPQETGTERCEVVETAAGRECARCNKRYAPVRRRCPKCGVKIDFIRPPSLMPFAGYSGPVMLNPCTHIVDVDVLREAGGGRCVA